MRAATKKPAKKVAAKKTAAKKAPAKKVAAKKAPAARKTATRETDRGRISVTNTGNERAVEISLSLRFDPKELGEDRQRLIYEGLGRTLAGALEPEEVPKFMEQLNSAKDEALAPASTPLEDPEEDLEEDDEEDEDGEEDGETADDGR